MIVEITKARPSLYFPARTVGSGSDLILSWDPSEVQHPDIN